MPELKEEVDDLGRTFGLNMNDQYDHAPPNIRWVWRDTVEHRVETPDGWWAKPVETNVLHRVRVLQERRTVLGVNNEVIGWDWVDVQEAED